MKEFVEKKLNINYLSFHIECNKIRQISHKIM